MSEQIPEYVEPDEGQDPDATESHEDPDDDS